MEIFHISLVSQNLLVGRAKHSGGDGCDLDQVVSSMGCNSGTPLYQCLPHTAGDLISAALYIPFLWASCPRLIHRPHHALCS